MVYIMNIGLAIRKCRRLRNLTLDELSKKIDISKSYLSLVEANKRKPSFDVLYSLSTAIDVPLYLLVYIGTEPSEVNELEKNLNEQLKNLIFEILKI
jgi:XRE family transcriptional regulator of biofilm formation